MGERLQSHTPKLQAPKWERIKMPDLLVIEVETALKKHLPKGHPSYKHARQVATQILAGLKKKGINIHDVSQLRIQKSHISFQYFKGTQKEEVSFHIGKGKAETLDPQAQSRALSKLVKSTEKVGKVLELIEHLFQQNQETFWEYLNENDTLDVSSLPLELQDIGKEFSGKHIGEIQQVAQALIQDIDASIAILPSTPQRLSGDIHKHKLKYLEFIMGVGDIYEGGAKFFKKSSEEAEKLIEETINGFHDINTALDYMSDVYKRIGENSRESSAVEKSYKILTKRLGKLMFQRLRKDFQSEKNQEQAVKGKSSYFLRLAKIVTGREGDVDGKYRDVALSNEIILYIMGAKGGIIDTIEKNDKDFKIEDPEMKGKNPASVVTETTTLLRAGGKGGMGVLKAIGFQNVLGLKADMSYENLSLEQKIKISTLVRLKNKLIELEKTPAGRKKSLRDVFLEINSDATKVIASEVEENFDTWSLWGKDADEYGLEGESAEIFNLFKDINGSGLFDLSDNTNSRIESGAKFGRIIAIAIATAVVVSLTWPAIGFIALGAAVGATATLASIVLSDKGHDSFIEAFVDIGTDMFVGTLSGAVGGHLIGRLGFHRNINWSKLWSKPAFRHLWWKTRFINPGLFGTEIVMLGLIPEAARAQIVEKIFQNGGIFQKKTPVLEK